MSINANKRNECIASASNLRTEHFSQTGKMTLTTSKISKFFTPYFGHSAFIYKPIWMKLGALERGRRAVQEVCESPEAKLRHRGEIFAKIMIFYRFLRVGGGESFPRCPKIFQIFSDVSTGQGDGLSTKLPNYRWVRSKIMRGQPPNFGEPSPPIPNIFFQNFSRNLSGPWPYVLC